MVHQPRADAPRFTCRRRLGLAYDPRRTVTTRGVGAVEPGQVRKEASLRLPTDVFGPPWPSLFRAGAQHLLGKGTDRRSAGGHAARHSAAPIVRAKRGSNCRSVPVALARCALAFGQDLNLR